MLSRLNLSVLCLLVGTLGTFACRSLQDRGHEADLLSVDPGLLLDVSDVSFLMPRPSQFFQFPAGANGLLTRDQFAQLPNFALRGHPTTANIFDKLHISAFRFDPCPPKISPDASLSVCKFMVFRLVAQVFENGVPTDAGIHLIYKLDNAERDGIVEELQKLKRRSPVPTAGRPLGVHPGFQGTEFGNPAAVAFANTIKAFITSHVNSEKLDAISTMVTLAPSVAPGPFLTWEWQSFPKKNGRFTAVPIEHAQGNPISHQFRAQGRNGFVLPPSLVVPALAQILNQAPQRIPAAIEDDFKIEHPGTFSVPEGDCASCHVSTPGRVHAENILGPLSAASQYRPMPGITGLMAANDRMLFSNQIYVTLNFAYFANQPAVSQRTINESVEVVRLINSSIIKRPPPIDGNITGMECFTGPVNQLQCPGGAGRCLSDRS